MGVIRKQYPPITGRLGFSKQVSQAIHKVLPILLVSKYLSEPYRPDQNVIKTPGESSRANLGMGKLLPSIYLFKNVPLDERIVSIGRG